MGIRRIRSKEGSAKPLAVLLVCLIFWGTNRISSPFQSILLQSDDTRSKDDRMFAPYDNKAHHNAINMTYSSVATTTNPPMRHPNFTFDFPLCLVHVGKAAGSSLSCGLGLMYADCEGMPRDPPLANTCYFHMKKDTCRRPVGIPNDNAKNNHTVAISTYLMPIRNPLTRIQSWFNFEKDIIPIRRNKGDENHFRRKRGMLFVECYDNFVDLVLDGLTPQLWNATITAERPANMTCPERAWAAVMGIREFSYHEWYNYEYYWTALQSHHPRLYANDTTESPASLMVIRTEHLSNDWAELSKEELFRPVNQGARKEFRSNSENTTVFSSRITSEQILGKSRSSTFWRNICHAMCPEIQVYKQILHHSQNLDELQINASLQEIRDLCPQESDIIRNCPGIPQFPLMRVGRRQFKAEVKKRLFIPG